MPLPDVIAPTEQLAHLCPRIRAEDIPPLARPALPLVSTPVAVPRHDARIVRVQLTNEPNTSRVRPT
jgi:hypothetical protein